MNNPQKIAVVTLNWNGKSVLNDMIASLLPQIESTGARLVVFDNCSTDGSDELALEKYGHYDWFSLEKADENLGFAAGANKVIGNISDDIIVLVNNDTVFLPGSLSELLAGLQRHSDAGMVGPRLLWQDRTLQPSMRDFPFPGKLFKEHFPPARRNSAKYSKHNQEITTDWVVGAIMAFRREVFMQVDGFDEEYFFYHEETDLQYRMYKTGLKTWFIPSAEVIHLEGVSARQKFGNETYLKYISEKVRFLKKHGYKGAVAVFKLLMLVLQSTRMIIGMLNSEKIEEDIRFSPAYCRKAISILFCRNNSGRNGMD